MQPAEGEPGVLRCPSCGHRSDEPGGGVLADGFDLLPWQWGLRGDPYTWDAVRARVAATPTPPDREGIRAAYVQAFDEVVGVDLDGTSEPTVYRPELDHGGMSAGTVSLEWWRQTGIPLLVERADVRRPAAASARPSAVQRGGNRFVGLLVWTLVLAIPLVTLGAGIFLLVQRTVGTPVQATVLECSTSGSIVRGSATYRSDCIAEWTLDGRTVVGPFTGGNGESDVGTTVDATVRGDVAYSRSLALPAILIALSLPFLWFALMARRARRRPPT
jgi:hypothetical protein